MCACTTALFSQPSNNIHKQQTINLYHHIRGKQLSEIFCTTQLSIFGARKIDESQDFLLQNPLHLLFIKRLQFLEDGYGHRFRATL